MTWWAVLSILLIANVSAENRLTVRTHFCTVQFTKNGLLLPRTFDIGTKFNYPVCGLYTQRASCRARFEPPFEFDYVSYVAKRRQTVIAQLLSLSVSSAHTAQMAKIVAERLALCGFDDALQRMLTEVEKQGLLSVDSVRPSAKACARLADRQRLRRVVLRGVADDALNELQQLNVHDDALAFDVAIVALIDRVRSEQSSSADCIRFAQTELAVRRDAAPSGSQERRRRATLLQRALSVLAYAPNTDARRNAIAEVQRQLSLTSLAQRANDAMLQSDDANVIAAPAVASTSADSVTSSASTSSLSSLPLLVTADSVGTSIAVALHARKGRHDLRVAEALLRDAPRPSINSSLNVRSLDDDDDDDDIVDKHSSRRVRSALEVLVRHQRALLAVLAARGSATAALVLSRQD